VLAVIGELVSAEFFRVHPTKNTENGQKYTELALSISLKG